MVGFSMRDPLGAVRLAIFGGIRRASMGADKRGVVGDHHPFLFFERKRQHKLFVTFPTDNANCSYSKPTTTTNSIYYQYHHGTTKANNKYPATQ